MLKGILEVDKQRTVDNKLKPYGDLKNTGKGKYLGKCEIQIYCTLVCSSFSSYDLKAYA